MPVGLWGDSVPPALCKQPLPFRQCENSSTNVRNEIIGLDVSQIPKRLGKQFLQMSRLMPREIKWFSQREDKDARCGKYSSMTALITLACTYNSLGISSKMRWVPGGASDSGRIGSWERPVLYGPHFEKQGSIDNTKREPPLSLWATSTSWKSWAEWRLAPVLSAYPGTSPGKRCTARVSSYLQDCVHVFSESTITI